MMIIIINFWVRNRIELRCWITMIPMLLDAGSELLEEECTLEHTSFSVGRTWKESSGRSGWSDSTCHDLFSGAQRQGRCAVMFGNLLNVLSKSLVFEFWDSSLHVLIAEIHCFEGFSLGEVKGVDLIRTLTLEFVF